MKTQIRPIPWAAGVLAVLCLSGASAEVQSGKLSVRSVQGTASYSVDHSSWAVLKPGMVLAQGAELRTGPGSTADLEFEYSGTVLRLRPDSLLELTRLAEMVAEENVIIDTSLNLKAGSLIGSQRKLAKPSTFTITTPNGSATIRGTEYLVTAAGAVTCFRGEVAVNSLHQGSPMSAEVPAGFSFNPATGQVAATASASPVSSSHDLQVVRDNSDKLGTGGDGFNRDDCDGDHDHDHDVSPHKGHHHHEDHDHDHDDHHGHNQGDDHGDGHY
ncbi:MAG TPA: FecR family protein [Candidatus Sulfopaludibacter sp.]|nr:FecR family protein [Candidatus Sulfopaludibacter sp.]